MPLPTVGGSEDTYGTELNTFLGGPGAGGAPNIPTNRVPYMSGQNFTSSANLTFDGTTLTTTTLIANTSISAPSIVTASGALTITPAAGNGVNINLSTTGDFAVNTDNIFVDTSAGNVGIGTTLPAVKFVLSGVSPDGSGLRMINTGAGGGTWTIQVGHTAFPPAAGLTFRNTAGDQLVNFDSAGNVGIRTTSFGASAVGVLAISNGTAPTTGPADSVQLYSTDDAAGHTIPSFFCEGTNVLATGQADIASSVRVRMRINGTVVTLLAI